VIPHDPRKKKRKRGRGGGVSPLGWSMPPRKGGGVFPPGGKKERKRKGGKPGRFNIPLSKSEGKKVESPPLK